MVLLLAACSEPCPSFGEVEVQDHTTAGADNVVSEMQRALDDFASWTGRRGVCVASMTAEDALTDDGIDIWGRFEPAHHYDGGYATEPGAVRIDREADAYDTTLHELCHAIDATEDHSDANPDIFNAKDIPRSDLYDDGAERVGEAFAEACEDGPRDVTLGRWMEQTCGAEVISAEHRYLAAHVYTHAPSVSFEEGEVPAWEVTGTVELPQGAYAGSWAAVGDTLVAGGDAIDVDGMVSTPALFVWRDGAGMPDRVLDLRPWNPAQYDPVLADAKDRVIVLTQGSPAPILELDGGGIREWPASVNKIADGAAYVDGSLYLSENDESNYGHLARIDELTGERTEIVDQWEVPRALDDGIWYDESGDTVVLRTDGTGERIPNRGEAYLWSADGSALDMGSVSEKHGSVEVRVDGSTLIVPSEPCDRPAMPWKTFYWNGRRAGVTTDDYQHFTLWRLGPA